MPGVNVDLADFPVITMVETATARRYIQEVTQLAMSTTTIEVRCNARSDPPRFVVHHADRDLLLSVIARATNLWGGIFNPIVIPR